MSLRITDGIGATASSNAVIWSLTAFSNWLPTQCTLSVSLFAILLTAKSGTNSYT